MLREAVLRYSREIAFAAAQVYAQAAEARGAWDARLEALVVDALLRGEADDARALPGRGARLGQPTTRSSCVVGPTPDAEPGRGRRRDPSQRAARRRASTCSTGVQGDRLVVVLGGVGDPVRTPRGRCVGAVRRRVRSWSVRSWPTCSAPARRPPRPRWPGCGRPPAWPDAPRPVLADDLLPERALAGDALARDAAGPARSTGRCSRRGPRCSRPCRRSSSRPRRSRRPPARCSCTPTPCATGCGGSPRSRGCAPTDPRQALRAAGRAGARPAGRRAVDGRHRL